MRHTMEELGDFAEDNAEGALHIFKTPIEKRGHQSPRGKPWGAKLGSRGDTHYGETPDEAVDTALDAHERASNPDNQRPGA